MKRFSWFAGTALVWIGTVAVVFTQVGREVAVAAHLPDDVADYSVLDLIEKGRELFVANWTIQEGGGRPFSKGTGAPLSDNTSPLLFPRNFNRISAPDSNSCAGCHNAPFGPGGGGDIVTNVFVLGQRFDFATFDGNDAMPTRGAVNEIAVPVTLQTMANSRSTLGMFGSGFIEMLARQITLDLQAERDATLPGGQMALISKGISYGVIRRNLDGTWDTSGVDGLPAPSLATGGAVSPPSLVIRPFHQAGNVISLRQFTVNAMNHHHGMQAVERWGQGADGDGDGFVNELSIGDITATTLFQAVMAVPGRVIPDDPTIEAAILVGERRFADVGCTRCHIPSLPLTDGGWVFSEPNPFNPPGNLQPGQEAPVLVDLTSNALPSPRLAVVHGRVDVPAYTDLKLHDITAGPTDPNREPLDMNQPAGSPGFLGGNGKFLTRKLWGTANEFPYFHHGMYTTLRQAVLAHAGEAERERAAFETLPAPEQDDVIEFLKSLQVLPPGVRSTIVDEHYRPKPWPPRRM
jgi:hypothetical protein